MRREFRTVTIKNSPPYDEEHFDTYAIIEIFYNENNQISSWSQPIEMLTDSMYELDCYIEKFKEARSKESLNARFISNKMLVLI